MRIITGKFKNFKLFLPKRINFRPTTDYIKQALFSSVGDKILNSSFLDIFSGCGNIGFEALSRGAEFVCFIENDKNNLEIIKKNSELLNAKKMIKIFPYDFKKSIKILFNKGYFFDIIFADPPYEKGFIKILAKVLTNFPLIKNEGIIIFQHSKREDLNFDLKEFILFNEIKHGDTKLSFLKRR